MAIGTPSPIVWGVSNALVTSADMSGADADLSAAPASGEKLVLVEAVISVGATDLNVQIKEETSGTVFLSIYLAANSTFHFKPEGKRKLATANKKFVGRTSASGNVSILLSYYSEP